MPKRAQKLALTALVTVSLVYIHVSLSNVQEQIQHPAVISMRSLADNEGSQGASAAGSKPYIAKQILDPSEKTMRPTTPPPLLDPVHEEFLAGAVSFPPEAAMYEERTTKAASSTYTATLGNGVGAEVANSFKMDTIATIAPAVVWSKTSAGNLAIRSAWAADLTREKVATFSTASKSVPPISNANAVAPAVPTQIPNPCDTTTTSSQVETFIQKSQDGRLPGHLVPKKYRNEPEAIYFMEIEKVVSLARIRRHNSGAKPNSLLDAGCGAGCRMLHRFGGDFDRAVALEPHAPSLQECQASLAKTSVNVTFVEDNLVHFSESSGSQQRFDVIILGMVMQHLPTTDYLPVLNAVRKLLDDMGVAIISTTHVEDGHGCYRLVSGKIDTLNEDNYNNEVKNATPLGPLAFRKWTRTQLLEKIDLATLITVDHALFTYITPEFAPGIWHDERLLKRSFADVLNTPVSQVAIVQRHPVYSPAYAPVHGAPIVPTKASVRSVVFGLVRGGSQLRDYSDFLASRRCLAQLSEEVYDEIAFHEGNVPNDIIEQFKNERPTLRFVDVRIYGGFGGDSTSNMWRPWVRLRRPAEYPVGYKHMCRFFAMQWIYALSKYEYAMRVDGDVCIHRIDDPFKSLRSHDAVYGYGLETVEKHDETVQTMQPWLQLYMFSRGITPSFPPVNVEYMYFTNLFVTKIAWWQRPEVQRFLGAVDRSGNIYMHRWGDAPIQTAALHLFGEAWQVRLISTDYTHLSTNNEIRNGTEVDFKDAAKDTAKVDTSSEWMYDKLKAFYRNYYAPCAVVRHYNLAKGPFTAGQVILALKGEISKMTGLSPSEIDAYSNYELAQILQFDLHHDDLPLPPESIAGSDLHDFVVRAIEEDMLPDGNDLSGLTAKRSPLKDLRQQLNSSKVRSCAQMAGTSALKVTQLFREMARFKTKTNVV